VDSLVLKRGVKKDLRSAFFDEAKQETGNGQNQKHDKQCLGNADRASGDAAKAEQGGNQGNDKKYNGIVQHVRSLVNKPSGLGGLNLSECQPAGLFADVHRGQTGDRDAIIMVCTTAGGHVF
jgi:hypothetical protein